MARKYEEGEVIYLIDPKGSETEYRVVSISNRSRPRVYCDIHLMSPDGLKYECIEDSVLDQRLALGTARLSQTPGTASIENDSRLDLIGFIAGIIDGRRPGSEGMSVLVRALCDKRDRPVSEVLSQQVVDRLKSIDAAGYDELAALHDWPR